MAEGAGGAVTQQPRSKKKELEEFVRDLDPLQVQGRPRARARLARSSLDSLVSGGRGISTQFRLLISLPCTLLVLRERERCVIRFCNSARFYHLIFRVFFFVCCMQSGASTRSWKSTSVRSTWSILPKSSPRTESMVPSSWL